MKNIALGFGRKWGKKIILSFLSDQLVPHPMLGLISSKKFKSNINLYFLMMIIIISASLLETSKDSEFPIDVCSIIHQIK